VTPRNGRSSTSFLALAISIQAGGTRAAPYIFYLRAVLLDRPSSSPGRYQNQNGPGIQEAVGLHRYCFIASGEGGSKQEMICITPKIEPSLLPTCYFAPKGFVAELKQRKRCMVSATHF
jgi:hypothetical protein